MNTIEKYCNDVKFIETIDKMDKYKSYTSKYVNPIFYLKRLSFFLKCLGDPQKKIKNYIHIGGTSGKGSTASYLHNIITSSGKKCGLFTSPFLTETTEKFKIGDKLISPKEFSEIVDQIRPALNKCCDESSYGLPSYFEICFAISILYFLKNKCDYIVSEVGLGGEFDATNVIRKTRIAIITHIDLDHTDLLGNTLEKIATTKSKIIKKNCVFLTVEERPHIRAIFKDECAKVKARYNYINPKVNKQELSGKYYKFQYGKENYKLLAWGGHQVKNAILAIEAAKLLDIKIDYIKEGLLKTKIPGRFEIIKNKPLVVLDVAHNPDKIKAMLDDLGLLDYKKLHVVYASAGNKDFGQIAQLVSPYADSTYITKFTSYERKSADPKAIKKSWLGKNVSVELDPWVAFKKAFKKATNKDAVLVTGSFYLVGEIRKKWFPSKKILTGRKII